MEEVANAFMTPDKQAGTGDCLKTVSKQTEIGQLQP
jgi:hypothetical protein